MSAVILTNTIAYVLKFTDRAANSSIVLGILRVGVAKRAYVLIFLLFSLAIVLILWYVYRRGILYENASHFEHGALYDNCHWFYLLWKESLR